MCYQLGITKWSDFLLLSLIQGGTNYDNSSDLIFEKGIAVNYESVMTYTCNGP